MGTLGVDAEKRRLFFLRAGHHMRLAGIVYHPVVGLGQGRGGLAQVGPDVGAFGAAQGVHVEVLPELMEQDAAQEAGVAGEEEVRQVETAL